MPRAKRKRWSKPDNQKTIRDFYGPGTSSTVTTAPVAEDERSEQRPNVRGAAMDNTSREGGAPAPKKSKNSDQKSMLQFFGAKGETGRQPTRSTLSAERPTRLEGSDGPSSPSMPSFHGNLIDEAANKEGFDKFVEEWNTKTNYAIALACEDLPSHLSGQPEGGKKGGTETEVDGIPLESEGVVIVGVCVCWGEKDAHYISLQKHAGEEEDATDEMIPPPLEDRRRSIKSVLEMEVDSRSSTKKVFDLKAQYKALAAGCDITMNGNFQDPKVADWLLDPDAKVKRFDEMVKGQFTPQESDLLQGLGECFGVGSLSMTVQNPGSGRTRAALECVLTFHLIDKLSKLLEEKELSKVFRDVEMPSLVALARLELNGAGFSSEECERQRQIMKDKLSMLEKQAHQLAGHEFALNSTKAVDKVLYEELKLEINEDPSTNSQPQERLSTSRKGVLEKLIQKTSHRLPGVILEWRRISKLLNKVTPLQKKNVYNPRLNMDRIYSTCNLHTATGRVAFHNPNLQFIPKEFEIEMPAGTDNEDGPPPAGEETMSKRKVCMRRAFIPFKGGVILAADYSQIELRIMAHLSNDFDLTHVLNSGQDVFKGIASKWKKMAIEDVSDELRQQAKQLCYGIIYGMGPKALGEKLGVSKEEGEHFIETFKSRYTGMRLYLQTTVDQCRSNGYVQTRAGRRRYLPDISWGNYYSVSQAERQAVNTTIQGSAADLVKKAMVLIDQRLQQEFPDTRRSHRQGESAAAAADTQKRTSQQPYSPPRGAYLILQLHDELIYEVHKDDVQQVAQIVKHEMENAMKLSIALPVKVKVGPTWGQLEDRTFE